MANLFTSQTPSITDASDGTPGITTATTVVFAVDGTVTGVRFYATATVGGTYTGALWEVTDNDAGTGTLLASKTLGSAPTGGTWNTITFDTPVSVTAGTPYRVGIFSGAGRYVATLGFFSSSLTNGDITAPAHNGAAGPYTVFQGTFAINAALTYPTGTSGSASYFADVEFTAAGLDPAAPDGLAVPVGLGAPTVATVFTVAPEGLAVATGLGAPTAVTAYTVAPNGLAVAVGLGEPAIIASAAPTGLAVSVELGSPTIGQASGSGGWHDFGGIIQGAINDARVNAERRRNPIDCPEHGWPLEITERGRHCLFGGHVVTGEW